jgi:TNF receptor-associated factor 4
MISKMAGFECEFAEKPPTTFPQSECPICLLVLREPYQATCCGKSFCKECIHRIKAANQACPTCNDKEFTLFPNKGLQQSLYDFRVYCTHKSKGCEWTGELRELDNHLNSDPPADKSLQGCPYTLINCPLGCAGCEKGVCRKDVKSHVNDKLLDRVVIHGAQMKSVEAQLKRIKEDKENLEQRVTELETNVIELRMENRKLDSPNRELEKELKSKQAAVGPADQPVSKQPPATFVTGTYKPKGAEFTMTNFEEYQMDSDEWYSSHFYTHPNGYKMCLKVFANGNGPRKGTHLSVYVRLMRGEFDDQLKWPFRGRITIKLVNQEKNEDHVVKTLISGADPGFRWRGG